MPSTSITFTNSDKQKILNHEAPYNSVGGWTNGTYIVLDLTITYDSDSTGLTAQRCIVDCGCPYSGSPHPPVGFTDHRFRIYFNTPESGHFSNPKGKIHYAQYNSSLGYFKEVSGERSINVSKSTDTYNSTTYTFLNIITVQTARYISPSRDPFSSTYNEYVNAEYETSSSVVSELMVAAADTYFNAQPVQPFAVNMDVWSTADAFFTFRIYNLQNSPLPHATYWFRGAYNPNGNRQAYVFLQPYTSDSDIQMDYDTIYNALPTDEARTNADSLGYIALGIALAHRDDNNPQLFVNDILANIHLYREGGNMTLASKDSNCNLTLHVRQSPYENDTYPDDDAQEDIQVPGQEMSVDNLLTTSYALTEDALKAFGSWLWANDLTQLHQIQSAPIENVLSCKRIPFTVPDVTPKRRAQIKCGNVLTGVGIDAGTGRYDGRVYIADSTHKQVIGSMEIPTYTGDFIDMENKISIYLPYCGIQTIPTSLAYKQAKDENGIPYLVGRTLKVEYYFDIVYGTCEALLYMGNKLFATYNGTCGVDIPLTASNRAANELNIQKMGANTVTSSLISGITGAISGLQQGGLLGMALGGLAGGGGTYLSGATQAQNERKYQDTHYSTAGSFSPQIANYMTSSVTLFIEHTKYKEPKTYGHDNGYPCNISYNLSDLKGYTEIDGACEMKGCECFEEEKIALKRALMEGFYL